MTVWKLPSPLDDEIPRKIAADLETVVERAAALKRAGRRVVMTNGAFDLLHVGHVRSLRHARALGDHLVVAVNSDASVRRAKGPGRPVIPQAERVEMLASLECVDTVFVFEEDTADRVLAAVKPDLHAKGPDYRGETPERATVLAHGGDSVVVGDAKDHSSTETLARLRGAGSRGAEKE